MIEYDHQNKPTPIICVPISKFKFIVSFILLFYITIFIYIQIIKLLLFNCFLNKNENKIFTFLLEMIKDFLIG